MNKVELQKRTKLFALRIIRLVENLPETKTAKMIASQIIRSGTSVGANYRAACRAKSTADFINKLKIVEEEADETAYWLELLIESKTISEEKVKDLLKENNELIAIFVSILKTIRDNQKTKIN